MQAVAYGLTIFPLAVSMFVVLKRVEAQTDIRDRRSTASGVNGRAS